MQFKNPEILYFLAALIIPILIHLFQLQKFVKVPFSNVAFLQVLQQQSRRSSRLKKWLILLLRMLLFAAIIGAFSQPYLSKQKGNKQQHIFLYLDNSLSTNSLGAKGNLLKVAAQDIIAHSEQNNSYSLLTNSNFYKDITYEKLKKILLEIENSPVSINLKTVFLKIEQEKKNKTNTLHKNIIVSDFQNTDINSFKDVRTPFTAIKLKASKKENLSIDSVYIDNISERNFTIFVQINNQGIRKENIPIALSNENTLISKQSFTIGKDSLKLIKFTVNKSDVFLGKLQIFHGDIFAFDNTYFFNTNNSKKTNILSIGKEAGFLSKIYTKEDFNFTQTSTQQINYNTIQNQELILLNELETIPEILANSLLQFYENKGSIVIIPNEEIALDTYNSFLQKLNLSRIGLQIKDPLKITSINYMHPIFKDVFFKKITNFQYPDIQSYYPIIGPASQILSFENKTPFISQLAGSKVYYVSGALNKNNSNFLNSPLVVPIFYNFGMMSAQYPKLAYRIDQENNITVEIPVSKEEILTISSQQISFIPMQRAYQNKVIIQTKEQPNIAGFYEISKKNRHIRSLAFNNPKSESNLVFFDFKTLDKIANNAVSNSIKEVFKEVHQNNEVHWLWKWFLIIAIVSLCLEILILKFYTS
jgi:hypothetical protein